MAPDLFSAPTHSMLLMLPHPPGTAEMFPNPFDVAAGSLVSPTQFRPTHQHSANYRSLHISMPINTLDIWTLDIGFYIFVSHFNAYKYIGHLDIGHWVLHFRFSFQCL